MIHGILIMGVMVTITLGATAIITTPGLVQSANALKGMWRRKLGSQF
jgi:hypothetical protein